MCHHVRRTITPAVADGVHLNRRQHNEIAKADYGESWLTLKTSLIPFVILSTWCSVRRARLPNRAKFRTR
jgi:hypothetical protein